MDETVLSVFLNRWLDIGACSTEQKPRPKELV